MTNNIIRAVDSELRSSLTRADLINLIALKIGADSYLEIGVQTGKTFHAVEIASKIGVDPDPRSKATLFMGSDQFFEMIEEDQKFDIIYVDGLHHWEQAWRDIQNAIKHLSSNGVIIVDDIAPKREEHQTRHISAVHWTGDVWKSWFLAMTGYSDKYTMFSVDIAFGQGIIAPNGLIDVIVAELSEEARNFNPNRDQWPFYLENHKLFHRMIDFEEAQKIFE